MGYMVPVGISNKHVHLTEETFKKLFGEDAELIRTKDITQPGQFSTDNKVDVVGSKKTIAGMRILGPFRPYDQVELSMTDLRQAGFPAVLTSSGKLEGTPGCKLIGPAGEVELEQGVIAVQRHVHLNPDQAKEAGVEDGEIVNVKVGGDRALLFENVVVRSSWKDEKEFHLDTDEGNAAGLKNNQMVEIIKL